MDNVQLHCIAITLYDVILETKTIMNYIFFLRIKNKKKKIANKNISHRF